MRHIYYFRVNFIMFDAMAELNNLFYMDNLSIILLVLINYVCLIVGLFAKTYLMGDANRRPFFTIFPGLIIALNLLVISNHIIIFLIFWGLSNYLLGQLMGFRSSWKAARESVILAYKTFAFGWFCLVMALTILALDSGTFLIQEIVANQYSPEVLALSASLILLSAMTQSALWPFHKWLISSLNSPTPVSAVMHAGLVNGGGLLLTRFAPLYMTNETFLTTVFAVGLMTAILGTFWKLLQTDYKRMLACSTMGQMGFMIAQCGLGLFPAAIAHLCWHGLYKAYMFLGSGSAPQERRYTLNYPVTIKELMIAIPYGLWGATIFAIIAHPGIDALDTRLILICVAAIAGVQIILPFIRQPGKLKYIKGIGLVGIFAIIYGLSIEGIEMLLDPMGLAQHYPLNIIHVLGGMALIITWLGIMFRQSGVGFLVDSIL